MEDDFTMNESMIHPATATLHSARRGGVQCPVFLDALSSISSPTRRILRVFFAAVLRRTGNTYNYTYKCRKLEHCRIGIGRRVLAPVRQVWRQQELRRARRQDLRRRARRQDLWRRGLVHVDARSLPCPTPHQDLGAKSHGLSANKQCFSLTPNQPTVLSIMAYKPNKLKRIGCINENQMTRNLFVNI